MARCVLPLQNFQATLCTLAIKLNEVIDIFLNFHADIGSARGHENC